MKYLALTGLAFLLTSPGTFAHKHCKCDKACQAQCEKGEGKDCKCKSCDCSKTGKCKHGKCKHEASPETSPAPETPEKKAE